MGSGYDYTVCRVLLLGLAIACVRHYDHLCFFLPFCPFGLFLRYPLLDPVGIPPPKASERDLPGPSTYIGSREAAARLPDSSHQRCLPSVLRVFEVFFVVCSCASEIASAREAEVGHGGRLRVRV